jgi:LysM repeat protein
VIKPGQVLVLPSTSSTPVVAERLPPQTMVTTAKRPATRSYEVQPGDTLWEIAQRFGTTVPTLAALNGLKQRQPLKAGQILLLPPPSSQEARAATQHLVARVAHLPQCSTPPASWNRDPYAIDRREGLLASTGV